jgi:hypothetical protein
MAHGKSIRIEASKRPHAESLQGVLTAFAPELVKVGQSWQVEILPGPETQAALDIFHTLGAWLEREQRASLTLHLDERAYTLLRPVDGQADSSTEFLLERIAQLQTALDSRIVIERAKGVLAERYGVGYDEAFEALRQAARSSRTELKAVAQRTADESETPLEIKRLLVMG